MTSENPDAPVRIANLGSGSKGNASVIRHRGRALVVDCGFSCRQMMLRMRSLDLDPAETCGILITHEHVDHVRGSRKFSIDTAAPVLATAGTLRAAAIDASAARPVRYDQPFDLDGFRVTPLRVSHDSAEPCAYLVQVAGVRALFLTDIGTLDHFDTAGLADLDYLYVEANHDPEMLRTGPYPAFLKKRIAGDHGHLDNARCGGLVADLAARSPRLRAVMLAHLSEKNNEPALALETARENAGELPGVRWYVAGQDAATDWT